MTKTVLLVEDDPMVMQCTEETLQGIDGVAVVTAKNGADALALVDGGLAFDLLLTDRQMPRMGGEALIAELRRRGCSQPFILMTGDLNVPPVIPGADLVATKPFYGRALVAAVLDRLPAPSPPAA